MNTLGIRISVSPEAAADGLTHSALDRQNYSALFDAWLEKCGAEVLEKVVGIHPHSGKRHHMHMHYILANDFKFKSRPLQTFKNQNKNCKLLIKDCVSIQIKKIPHLEESDLTYNNKRFLSYVAKERLAVPALSNTTYDIDELTELAAAEYEAVCVKKEKALNATMKTLEHKHLVEEFLHNHWKSNNPNNAHLCPRAVLASALKHFQKKDFPYLKTGSHAAQWCYAEGILPYDFIIDICLKGFKASAATNMQNEGYNVFAAYH